MLRSLRIGHFLQIRSRFLEQTLIDLSSMTQFIEDLYNKAVQIRPDRLCTFQIIEKVAVRKAMSSLISLLSIAFDG